MSNTLELAWASGVVDAKVRKVEVITSKGRVTGTSQGPAYRRVRFAVTGAVGERLTRALPGSSVRRHREGNGFAWTWTVQGSALDSAFEALAPWLSSRTVKAFGKAQGTIDSR